MKRFSFRLERVRRVRRVLDQQARQDLAGAIADRVAAEGAVENLREAGRERIAALDELQAAGEMDVAAVLAGEADLLAIGHRVELALEVVEDARIDEDRAMESLAAARRDLAVVEKLRERALSEHRMETQKGEAAEIDEHVARRYAVANADAREDDR